MRTDLPPSLLRTLRQHLGTDVDTVSVCMSPLSLSIVATLLALFTVTSLSAAVYLCVRRQGILDYKV